MAHAVEFTGQLTRAEVDASFVAQPLRRSRRVGRASATSSPKRRLSDGRVIASSIPPFEDLVRENETGWRVPVEDVDGWAAALSGALRDRDRARAMGRAGAAWIRTISEPGAVAGMTIAAHEHAIDRCRTGRRAGQ